MSSERLITAQREPGTLAQEIAEPLGSARRVSATAQLDERPVFARRIRSERLARGWSQADAVRAMQARSTVPLSSTSALIRSWKRWEAGVVEPDAFNRELLARTFGTLPAALFPRNGSEPTAPETLSVGEMLSQLRASDLRPDTLAALTATVDRLCEEYAYIPAPTLVGTCRKWLAQITAIREHRLTLAQHREVLRLAGVLALLVGCLEYDMAQTDSAEASRLAALRLGRESGSSMVEGWAHEMRAWFSLTQGDLREAIIAARQGLQAAPRQSVSVQLLAQEAKAWARLGDRRRAELALDRGRRLLDSFEAPSSLENHFVVDPTKFDFYAMDCYRVLGEGRLAQAHAMALLDGDAGIEPGSRPERAPMRNAEARFTLAVVAAQDGDLDGAVHYGRLAINGARTSLPSLAMVSREFVTVLRTGYSRTPMAMEYLDELNHTQLVQVP